MNLQFPKPDNETIIEQIKKKLENFKIPSISSLPELSDLKMPDINKLKEQFTIKQGISVLVVLLIIFVGIFALSYYEETPKEFHKIKFKVIEGMDAQEIARRLEKAEIIESGFKFRMLAKWEGYEDKLRVGSYNLSNQMTYEEILEKLVSGQPETVNFTIPEGFGVKDIANRLAEEGLIDKEDFLKKAEKFIPYDYIEKHDNAFYYCEGFLFPDTYEVESDIESEDILKIMAENFDYRLSKKMRERAKEENLSIYQLITLASLVEKEVRFAEDRAVVAQVFLKRLKLDMPLQTDASLQYLMDAPKEDVSIEDTKIDSPYNTYQHKGLTPGPIANPGLASINAVLYPAGTDYLYFVADRSGHNHYSDNYEEHLQLVEQYR